MGALVFGSPEAVAILRRDRLAQQLQVDNGAKGDAPCMDHLFIGLAQTALCGAGRAGMPGSDEWIRDFDPSSDTEWCDGDGVCPDCLHVALGGDA